MKILESQTSRENQIIQMVEEICPELVLVSRTGKALMGGIGVLDTVPERLARLRFQRKKRSLFGFRDSRTQPIHDTLLAFTITCQGNMALDLERGWIEIEVHVFDRSLLQEVKQILAQYKTLTGKDGSIILEE